eukprot:scaffold251036_cov31-Attheya_sp.AAC.1
MAENRGVDVPATLETTASSNWWCENDVPEKTHVQRFNASPAQHTSGRSGWFAFVLANVPRHLSSATFDSSIATMEY